MTDSTHITIGGRQIGAGQPCFVIAEAGINHNGDATLAAELVDAAAAKPAPTRSSSRRTFPSTRCCAAARRPPTSASRCSIC